VRVWRIAADEVEGLRCVSDVEAVERAAECDDAGLECVFPYQQADFGEELGEECECSRW